MKKLQIFSLLFIFCALGVRAQSDPVVMVVNGEPVTRSEFEYSFNKNNEEKVRDPKSLREYVDLFVNYKLKVAEAKTQKLDTLSSFRNEFKSYRDQQADTYLVDEDFIEQEAQKLYEQSKKEVGPDGLIRVSHILVLLKQNATPDEQKAAKARIDSIYNLLQGGEDFAKLAIACSDDKATSAQGSIWIQRHQTLKEFEETAYGLKDGEYSAPVLSSVGYHIIKRFESKPFGEYSEYHDNIKAYLERQGIREAARMHTGEKLAKLSPDSITPQQALAREDSLLEQKYPDFKNLMREYHDGLLLFEVSNRQVWDKASKDEAGLQKYFKKHKKDYKFDAPRYKGALLYSANNAILSKAQTRLKKEEPENYTKILRQEFNKDSVPVIKIERGPFKSGDNGWVDKMVFGKSNAQTTPIKGYPAVGVVGKILKKGPESYNDVRGQVTADYQNYLEKEWVKQLRSKYKVVINEEVLKTVNNHS